MPVNQLLIGLAVKELANGINDVELKGHIQSAAEKVVAKNSQSVARG